MGGEGNVELDGGGRRLWRIDQGRVSCFPSVRLAYCLVREMATEGVYGYRNRSSGEKGVWSFACYIRRAIQPIRSVWR
jgi:hypothetical protein